MSETVVRRRSRTARLISFLVVLLIVLAGLLLIADRAGAALAERTVADEVKKEVAARGVTSSEPDVEIAGFPFLTQVARGRYDKIRIVMRDVAGQGVQLPRLDVEARDVTASARTLMNGEGRVIAEQVSGTATIGYASVANLINQPGLRLSEQDGRLLVNLPVEVLGQRLTLAGTADLAVAGSKIRVRFRDLKAEGVPDIPAARNLINQVADKISVDVALPALPFDLAVQKVTPRPDGLAITASARGVPLNS
ncbi:MAG TPA: DUF2993 domain-containing protein [Micromonosporaceae bacterium]